MAMWEMLGFVFFEVPTKGKATWAYLYINTNPLDPPEKKKARSRERRPLLAKIVKILPNISLPKPSQRLLEEKLISLLKSSCKAQTHLHQVHAQITTHGFQRNGYVTPQVVASYAALGLGHARKVFDEIPQPTVYDYNALLRVCARDGSHKEVVLSFKRMIGVGLLTNCYTFPVVLKSCVEDGRFVEGGQLHCFVVKSGFYSNAFVGTGLIELYATRRMARDAYRVFGEMVERNVVVWTTMINGYISSGETENAHRLFDLAPDRDVVMWSAMFSGYIQTRDIKKARDLFDRMPNKDVMSWNTLMNGYANIGDIGEMERLFEEMPERNVFSWNVLLGGYLHNAQYSEVLSTFKRMMHDDGKVAPTDATFVTVLSACTRSGALDLGKWIHEYAEDLGYKGNVYIGNALIDMYAKCGLVDYAVDVFRNMEKKDLITWNTIIGGLAVHGAGADALNLFSEMKDAKEKPDRITFIGVICACSHMGLVEDGFSYFASMVDDYSIAPEIEHYGCMVDLLGRAGLLAQAMDFVAKMPMKPDSVIWASLLAACRVYKNAELGEIALRNLAELEPDNPANYVMLSNIYGDLGKSEHAARLKVAMRDTGFKKSPGYSMIEVNASVVKFHSMDEKHPETDLVYQTLRNLSNSMRPDRFLSYLMDPKQKANKNI